MFPAARYQVTFYNYLPYPFVANLTTYKNK